MIVGLNLLESIRTKEPLINTRLLLSKFSVAAYLCKYVFKIHKNDASLFPALHTAEIFSISNTLRGTAKVCAADDLDLSLAGGNDQIEFFDNYFSASPEPRRERFVSNPQGFQESLELAPFNYDVPSFPDFSPSTSLVSSQPPHLLVLSSFYDAPMGAFDIPGKPQMQYLQILSQSLPIFDKQPQLNLYPTVPPYFNDFKHPQQDSLSVYGSSSDSYVSPLDEMFFKNPAGVARPSIVESDFSEAAEVPAVPVLARKRKPTSPLTNETMFFSEMMFKERVPDMELPCDLKMSKKIKVDVKQEPCESVDEMDPKSDFKFMCVQCSAGFKVKSYLTRHLRKHNNANAFVCPFYEDPQLDNSGSVVKSGTKCHPTGGFSRRDTYKTHLKALHFIYPPGTKSSERNSIGGRCAGCFEFFDSNTKWLKFHIESGSCKGTTTLDNVYVKQEVE